MRAVGLDYESDWDEEDRDAPLAQDVIAGEEEIAVACPHCARAVHEDAPRCPYCGFWIVDGAGATGTMRGWSWMVALVLVMLLLFVWVIF